MPKSAVMLLEGNVLFICTQFSNLYTSQAPLQASLRPGSGGGAVGPTTEGRVDGWILRHADDDDVNDAMVLPVVDIRACFFFFANTTKLKTHL